MKCSYVSRRFVRAIVLVAAFLFTLAPRQAAATTRQWTGVAGAPFAWSVSNNWSPTGVPQTNDDLVFTGMVTSSNDISGAVVQTMRFNQSSAGTSILRGLAVRVRIGISGMGSGGMSGANFDVQCPIILDNDQAFSFENSRLTLSGGIDLNGHHLNLNSFPVGANMFVGPIFGTGSINANAGGTVHLFGTGNAFTGTFRVSSGLVVFEKAAGQLAIPATAQLEIAAFARVQLQGNDQIFDSSPVILEGSAQLLLNGFNEVLSGGVSLGEGSVVDCGNNYTTPGLTLFNTLTVRATNSPALIRNGIVNLPSLVALDIDGPALPALEIRANLIGTGFAKSGGGVLRLSGTNSYTDDAIIEGGIAEAFHRSAFGATSGVVQLNGGSIRLSNLSITDERLIVSGSAFQSSNDTRQAIFGAGLFVVGTCSWDGLVRLDTNLFIFADNNNVTMTFSGVISGAAGLLMSSGIYNLSGASANNYAGETIVSAAQLRLFKASAVGGELVIGTSVTGDSAATHFANNAVAGRAVRVNGNDAYYILNGFNQELTDLVLREGGSVSTGLGTLSFSGNSTVDIGSLTIHGPQFQASISGNISLVSGTTLACSVRSFSGAVAIIGPEFDIRATIAGSGTITKDGFGNMRFAGTNTFGGDIIVNEGALDLNNPGALGDTTFPIIVNNSGTLLLEVLGLSLPGIFFNGKTLILNSSDACALRSINGSNTWNGPIVLSRDSGVCLDTDYLNVPTTISGPGGLVLDGTGVLQFSGFAANTYAGRTLVKGGRLDAFRPNQISIPGDVVVGEAAQPPTTAVMRILRDRQISPNANVNVGGNGAFLLLDSPGPAPRSQVRTISGKGIIHIDPGSVLTVSNDVPCRFDGRMEGSGFIVKFGSSIMEWTAMDSTHSGLLIVEAGEFLMNGAAGSMDVQVSTNAVLRGDGYVMDIFIKPQGTLGADSKFPDHQGGDLETESLFLAVGSTLSLDFFGPAPTGSNDQIVVSLSSASINGANLQPIFHYPPRSGDVITVLNKDSGGPIVGTFNNWPQGTVRTFNGIPLHINYTGGTGNDITLTVTNLGLSFFNYTLVEGNGNQTVERDECNLLFISLFNRRPSTLRITNAVLRSLTPDALVTIPSASYPPITIGNVAANITPFQFRTRPGIGCGNPVSFELALGVANEGEFAITFSPVSGNDCTHPTGPCESCTVVSGKLDSNAPTTLKPIYFVGGPSLCFPPKACPGVDTTSLSPTPPTMSYVTHSFTNSATNEVCVTVQIGYSCPSFIFPRVAAYLGAFDTNDVCANYLGDGGVSGGTSAGILPFSFRVPAGSNFVLVVTTRANLVCPDYALQLFGLPCPPPAIGIGSSSSAQVSLASPAETTRRGGPLIGINWSTASPGWTAQQASHVDGNFTDILQSPALMDGRYVVTNIPATNNQFYRLRK